MDKPEQQKLDPDLAKRLHHALTASSEELFQVVTDVSPEVLRAVLKNRNLNEDHLLALLKRVDLSEDLLKAVYQYEQQNQSRQLKKSLVKNRNTPGPITLALLPHLLPV